MFRHTNKLLFGLVVLGLAACANRSRGPQGGPQDFKAPQAIKSYPANGSLNFKAKKIEIEFSEFLNLDNPQEKVIVSPPQVKPAEITSIGKKIYIELHDTLVPNSTYSIDFTNSISDINESNKLNDYTFSFSTGGTLDTLRISGTVLEAASLNPLANQQVGIYEDLSPKAFTSSKPLRISKTDENGKFCIKNIKAGTYRIYALNDLNRDFFYNDPNEVLAFTDVKVSPSVESVIKSDTIHHDDKTSKTHKDSIIETRELLFKPNDIVLKSFKQDVYKQYFIKAERKVAHKASFFFFGENKKRAQIKLLNVKPSAKDLVLHSAKGDTIDYWFADSTTFSNDSLNFELSYLKPDSTGTMLAQIDTVMTVYKTPKAAKRKKKAKAEEINFLEIKSNLQESLDVYKPIQLSFEMPVSKVDKSKFRLYSKVDTVWKQESMEVKQVDSIGMKYEIAQKWNPDLTYRLEADSASCISYYNTHNNTLKREFKIKGPSDYSTLIVSLLKSPEKGILQVLNNKDAVVKQIPANPKGTVFEYLQPGEYYIRMFIDNNSNGIWDSGNFGEQKQAEEVYYFNAALQLKANWELEQEWDYTLIPLTEQKPVSLLPKAKK